MNGSRTNFIEPRVLESLASRNSVSGVITEQLVQEVDTIAVEHGEFGSEVLGFPLGEDGGVVLEATDARPQTVHVGRSSEEFEDLEELADFGVTTEEDLAAGEFSHDATDGPEIDGRGVVLLTEENFGGAVPEGDDLVSVGVHGDLEGAGETEVGDLEGVVVLEEDVGGLQVAVNDAVAVAEVETFEELSHENLELTSEEGLLAVESLLEILVDVLEDEEELGAVADNVEEVDDVAVVNFLEDGDLTEGGLRNTFVAAVEAHLLEGDNLAGLTIDGAIDDTICTFTKNFLESIAIKRAVSVHHFCFL